MIIWKGKKMLSPKAIENGHFFRLEVIEDKIQGNFFRGSLMDNSVFTVDSERFALIEEAESELALLRAKQPTRYSDIRNGGFIFTN